jgi:hypothetical protein
MDVEVDVDVVEKVEARWRRLRRETSPDQWAPHPQMALGGAQLGAPLRNPMWRVVPMVSLLKHYNLSKSGVCS